MPGSGCPCPVCGRATRLPFLPLPELWHSTLLHTLHVPRYLSAGSQHDCCFLFSPYHPPSPAYSGHKIVQSFPSKENGTMTSADFSQFVVTTGFHLPVRPPRVRTQSFSPSACHIYRIGLESFGASVCYATLPGYSCLVCGFCSSGQRFARQRSSH